MNDKTSTDYNIVQGWISGFMDAHYTQAKYLTNKTTENNWQTEFFYEGYQLIEVQRIGGYGDGKPMSAVLAIVPAGSLPTADEYGHVTGAKGYIKLTGFYSSWDDHEWDDSYTIVNPKPAPGFVYE